MVPCSVKSLIFMCLGFATCITIATSKRQLEYDYGESIKINIDANKLLSTTKDYFVSYTLDTSDLYQNPPMNLTNINFQYMAKQLSPAVLRVGGTTCDTTYYFNNITSGNCDGIKNGHCFTKTLLENLMNFVIGSKAKLVFCISLQSPYNTSKWNSSNAELFLNYIIDNGYSDNFYGFELGNEVNGKVEPEWQVNAFKQFKQILINLNYTQPLLLGPDASNNIGYFTSFVADICSDNIIDIFTYHSYVGVNSTQLLTLNGINAQYKWSERYNAAVSSNCPKYKMNNIVAGEIGEHDDGGINGTTNRYIDSFWYLDAFGSISLLGQGSVFRQQLWGLQYHPNYALLNTKQFIPLPDYWIAVLFNRLINEKVLNVTSSDDYLRVYAYCSNNNDGSIILTYINLKNNRIQIEFDDNLLGKNHADYLITSNETNNALDTVNISLNGFKLELNKDHTLPNLNGNLSTSNPIQIYNYSIGFIHFIDTKAAICQ